MYGIVSVFKERQMVLTTPHSAQFVSGKVRASVCGVSALHLEGSVPGGIRLECFWGKLVPVV